MNKKELFDAFDGFSQNLMVTLAEIEAMKKQVQSLVEENTILRLENTKLRERLSHLEHETVAKNPSKQRKDHLEEFMMKGFISAIFSMDNVVKMMKNVCFAENY